MVRVHVNVNHEKDLSDLPDLMLDIDYRLLKSHHYFIQEVDEWCEQTLKESVDIIQLIYKIKTTSAINGTKINFDLVRKVLVFKNASDMIAFKLRWL